MRETTSWPTKQPLSKSTPPSWSVSGAVSHVARVRKRGAIHDVESAARDAERNALRLVGRGLDERGAEIGRRVSGEMRRQHAAQAERGEARVRVAQPVLGGAVAVP